MNREELVASIMSLPGEVLLTEPDCLILCQEHWQQYLHLYECFKAGDEEQIRQSLYCGSWSDDDLYLYLHQLESLQRLLNEL